MDLSVHLREVTGKKVAALRKEGLIPAELYGHGVKNVHLSVPAKEFNKLFKTAGSTTVITLVVGKEKHSAMVHDIARDPLMSDIMHIDFHEVRMDEKISAHVPVEFTGEAPAVREKGAVVNRSLAEIEVEAFPQDLPHAFVVDLSVLTDIDMSIHVKDVAVPKGVVILTDGETVIASAAMPAPEEEVAADETVDVSAIKSEADEKKAERDASKTETEA